MAKQMLIPGTRSGRIGAIHDAAERYLESAEEMKALRLRAEKKKEDLIAAMRKLDVMRYEHAGIVVEIDEALKIKVKRKHDESLEEGPEDRHAPDA